MFSFVETKLFTRLVLEYLSDDDYSNLQKALMEDPQAGKVIPRTGGVRKLRWGAPGRGKRGGYRVIYYLKTDQGVIWMLSMYPKNLRKDIPAKLLRDIRRVIE